MTKKVKFDDVEYDIDSLSDKSKAIVNLIKFASEREQELKNMVALLTRAKNGYIETLKREMISGKSGFLLDDE